MNKTIIWVVVLVIVGGGAFYGGMAYGKGQAPARGQFGTGGFAGRAAGGTGTSGARGGGITAGEVLSKDATSMTVKMSDGSTKIVLLDASVQIMKSAAGTLDDLSIGKNVVVTGSANSDGSVTAEVVQIRPATTTRMQ